MRGGKHDDLRIRIATIEKGDRGHATNKKVSWGSLREQLGEPVRDKKYTLEQYLALPIDKQNKLKDVGSFVGGPFRDGIRKLHHLIQRSVVTLDIDSAKAKNIQYLKDEKSEVNDYEFFASTTRKHTDEKPRWRLVFPLTRPLELDEYAPVARILASKLFRTEEQSMDAVDDVSYRPAQVMYWPSVCKGAAFDTIYNPGELLDPDELLETFENEVGDWRDWTLLPFSEARGQKRPTTGAKAEDPREKKGVIGAFCRAYSVEDAIERYLPDVYLPGDEHSSKPRYTYAHGSSSNGAIIEDDGLFLYSHHGTDPCAERLVNAFDLVRIHLFGELDHEAPEDASATELPSFEAMKKLVLDDENARYELQDADSYAEPEFEDLGDDEEDEKPKKKEKKSKETSESEPDEHSEGPDMSILEQSRYPAPEFPLDILGPFWADRAKQWARNAAAPIDYSAMTLLTGASSLIGNARWVQPKPGWAEPPVLWCTLVGDPSSNKSPAMGPLSGLLAELEQDWIPEYEDALRDYEADKKRAAISRKVWEQEMAAIAEDADQDTEFPSMPKNAMEPPKPIRRRAMVTDVTLESLLTTLSGNPKGLLNLRDELSGWFTNLSRYTQGSDRPAWLEAYGGRPYTVDRVKYDGAPLYVRRFSVSILGGIQPGRLLDILKSTEDGLQARFMFCWPDTEPKQMTIEPEEDNGAVMAMKKLSDLDLDLDKKGNPVPVICPMTKKAWNHFCDWDFERQAENAAASDSLRAAYGKARGLVARIALILEHLWWASDMFDEYDSPEVVSLKAVKAAIRLRDEYIRPMQMRVFSYVGQSESERLGQILARWVLDARPDVVNTRQLTHYAKLPGLTEAGPVTNAIQFLVERDWLIPVEKVKTSKAGRPRRDFTVNPAVYKRKKRK